MLDYQREQLEEFDGSTQKEKKLKERQQEVFLKNVMDEL